MKYLFVGSFNEKNESLRKIEANIKLLTKTIFSKGGCFYLRDSPIKSGNRYPIDSFVYSALFELYESDKNLSFKNRVTVLYEGSTKREDYADFCCFMSITNSDREQFFNELLNAVDIIIGVAGSLGTMRLYMICELKRKPFIVLPGSREDFGDLIANDFLTKSFQTKHIKPELQKKIRSLPLLCHSYSEPDEIYDTIDIFYTELMNVIKKINNDENISLKKALDKYTIKGIYNKLTVNSWLIIIGIVISIITTTIFIHSIYLENIKPFINNILGSTDK